MADATSDNLAPELRLSLAAFPLEDPHPVPSASGEGIILFSTDAAALLLTARVGGSLPAELQAPRRDALATGAAQADPTLHGLPAEADPAKRGLAQGILQHSRGFEYLALWKEIVERHAGRIWAESAAGQGPTLCFTLPQRGG